MTNEELLARLGQEDEAALEELIAANAGLIRNRAVEIARRFHCLCPGNYGGWSDYTKETLSELESVGTLAMIECIRAGEYDGTKGGFTTYVTPFLDGAMRRHLESSMGTLSLDRDSMALVRKAQTLRHREGKTISEISEALGISERETARAVAYPTYFLSVYDLVDPEMDGDPYDRLPIPGAGGSAEEEVLQTITMDCLQEEFLALPKRDRDILGRCFGVFGYEKCELREIAIRNRLREDGVEKAKGRALKKLRERCLDSLAWKLRRARGMVDRARRGEVDTLSPCVPMTVNTGGHRVFLCPFWGPYPLPYPLAAGGAPYVPLHALGAVPLHLLGDAAMCPWIDPNRSRYPGHCEQHHQRPQ